MKLSTDKMLQRLGAGDQIDSVCAAAGISRNQFDAWWREECERRAPAAGDVSRAALSGDVQIARDARGIPHISAKRDDDLFFGYGYAMAQDRLWQMDYLRRKAQGRLSELLGPDGLALDLIARTVGMHRIAQREAEALPPETKKLLDAFGHGVNAAIADVRAERLPIEFALLGYEPEPWSPVDSLAIWGELRYYLTVRFPVIVLPELARRILGDEALVDAFLTGEAGDESIIPAGSYPPRAEQGDPVGETVNDPMEGAGSNNWVVAGSRSATGVPLLASDPHIAFASVGCWYEAHLAGGSFNLAGAGYVGMPGMLFGRSARVAWGITNNICSQRDLYQERTDPDHPGAFLYDGQWEPFHTVVETIAVRGSKPVAKTVTFSRNGPIVDELLPKEARETGPVALRWLGATLCDELTPMLAMNRARSCDEFRAATRGWRVPTLSAVFADVDGHIGYQSTGQIPIRLNWQRGYRPGWDAAHQWKELVPFEGMPSVSDPASGWVRSANNRTAPEDYPYPLSGTWSSGHRAQRIRNMLEEQPRFGVADFVRMQQDVLSLRAVEAVPPLVRELIAEIDERILRAAAILESWDRRMEVEAVGASLFETFFRFWSEEVARERFPAELAGLMGGALGGLALGLLSEDKHGWYAHGNRHDAIIRAFNQTLDDHTKRLGPDLAHWTWGHTHTIALRHTLSSRGELGQLLNRGGLPVRGSGVTVCNTGYDPNYMAALGANFRLIVDLSTTPPSLQAVDAAGQSGNPGSPNYGDQLSDWIGGQYHTITL